MPKVCAAVLVLLAATLVTQEASAQYAAGGSESGVTRINVGSNGVLFDGFVSLGFDSAVEEETDATVKRLDVAMVWLPSFRRFVTGNLALRFTLAPFYKRQSITTEFEEAKTEQVHVDRGGAAILYAEFYGSMNNSTFFVAGIGGGGFIGERQTPVEGEDDQLLSTTIGGGVGAAHVGLEVFVSPAWSLRGGVDLIAQFGFESPDEPEEDDDTEPLPEDEEDESSILDSAFTSIDLGLTVGLAYTF